MQQYKWNLSVLNGRYWELERRALTWFAEHPDRDDIWLDGSHLLWMNLLKGDLLRRTDPIHGLPISNARGLIIPASRYQITDKGREFIHK